MDLVPPEETAASYARVRATVDALTAAQLDEPSALPGWSRADVVTHLASSADAYRRLLALARGDAPPLAPAAARSVSATDPRAVRENLRASFEGLFADALAMPAAAWEVSVTARAGWPHPAWFTLHRCLRELEHHHVDLAAGYRPADWPAGYVAWALDDTLAALAQRGFELGVVHAVDLGLRWDLGADRAPVVGPGYALLGRLSGRADGREPGTVLPVVPAWPLPPARGWS